MKNPICNARVWSLGGHISSACSNRAKHDPDVNGNPTKCGIHSAAAVQRRKDKSDAKMQEWRDQSARKEEIRKIRAEMMPLIRSIAEGHNDPRTACREWLDRYERAAGEDK